jgi:hypothetical protein
MSQIMEFFAGDADALIQRYRTAGLRAMRDAGASDITAGFYNIALSDLDMLTEEACELVGEARRDLSGALVEVKNSGAGGDFYVVSPQWVQRFAGIPDASIDQLGTRLIAALAREYPNAEFDEVELGKGIHDLIAVCRDAVNQKTDVVFIWT